MDTPWQFLGNYTGPEDCTPVNPSTGSESADLFCGYLEAFPNGFAHVRFTKTLCNITV
jgi:hypothetical protein